MTPRCSEVNSFRLYPWVHQWTNLKHTSDQTAEIKFPDINPTDLAPNTNFSMAAGDFLEVYTETGRLRGGYSRLRAGYSRLRAGYKRSGGLHRLRLRSGYSRLRGGYSRLRGGYSRLRGGYTFSGGLHRQVG